VTEPPFALVILCTANRFRSPLAAARIRAETAGLPLAVTSFATSGPTGPAPLPQALTRGRSLGLDLDGHRATRLGRGELRGADLVLGFERSHVAAAVIEGGAPRERTFTMPEFVALAEEALVEEGPPAERARRVVEAAQGLRAGAAPAKLAELADPAGGPERGYDRAANEIVQLSRRLVQALFEPGASQS
jgi:protein-tyrosine phosphatase